MALNQTIVSPLTNITGSLSSFTSPSGNALKILSSYLPAYQATEWRYKILTTPFTTTLASLQSVTGLQLTLANSKKYIINGYLLASSIQSTNGIGFSISTTNAQAYYYIENPASTTGMSYTFNGTTVGTGTPSTNINDYTLILIRAIVITTASGIPTFTPTLRSENNTLLVAIGPPSILYYTEY
jgi:hypothetical protein